MEELNKSLVVLISDFREGRVDLSTTINRLDFLIEVFSENYAYKSQIVDLENFKSSIKGMMLNIKQYELLRSKSAALDVEIKIARSEVNLLNA